MSTQGHVLAQGVIRVDARRAVAKLREHLLVDLHGYMRDLARAAVLAKATRLQVHYDADDLYLRFDGEVCSPSEAEHLLDFALAAPDDDSGRRLRMLALGVNTALGLKPLFVDVYTATAAPGVVRVRFEPGRLDNADDEVSLACEVDTRVPPDERGVPGTCIHIRRKWGWGVLRRAVTREAPPEVRLLIEAARRMDMTVERQDQPVRPDPHTTPLVSRVVPGRWSVGVELMGEASGPPTLEYLERSVPLITEPWQPWYGAPTPRADVCLPLRAVVDADTLPTDASRSALRPDPRIEVAKRTLVDALGACLSGAAAVLTGQGDEPAVEVLDRDVERLGRSLGVVVNFVLACARNGAEVPTPVRAVLAQPLLRNGVGEPLATGELLDDLRGGGRLTVLRARAPLPGDHAPWMKRVVWVHAPYIEDVIAGFPQRDVEEIIDLVKSGVQRRNRLLSNPASPPRVPPLEGELLRETFHVDRGPLAGLHGELCVIDPSVRRGARFRYYVDARMIESEQVAESELALVMEAAVAWEENIVPTMGYDAVERNPALQQAIRRVVYLAVVGLANACRRGDPAPYRHAVRLAFASAPDFANTTGLRDVAAWPTTTRELVSLAWLTAGARPVCTVSSEWLGERVLAARDRRPVVVVSPSDSDALDKALHQTAVLAAPYELGLSLGQDYDASQARSVLRASLEAELLSQEVPVSLLVWFDDGRQCGFIAPSLSRRAVRHHLGRKVATTPRPLGLGTTSIAIDEAALVPDAEGTAILWSEGLGALHPIDKKLCDVVVGLIEGTTDWDAAEVSCSMSPAKAARHPFMRGFALSLAVQIREHRDAYSGDAFDVSDVLRRLAALPLLTWIDGAGDEKLASLQEVRAAHAGTVPIVVESDPGASTARNVVKVASEGERELLDTWLYQPGTTAPSARAPQPPEGDEIIELADSEVQIVDDRVDIGAILMGVPERAEVSTSREAPRGQRPGVPAPSRVHAAAASRLAAPVIPAPSAAEDPGYLGAVDELVAQVLDREENDDPCSAALHRAIRRLPNAPRCSVEEATEGPLIRFVPSRNALVVRSDHPGLRRALDSRDKHALRALSAAIFAEINRELDVVTDAEERRALAELFQAWDAGR